MISPGKAVPDRSASRQRASPAGRSTVAITTLTSVTLGTTNGQSNRFRTGFVPRKRGADHADRTRTQCGALKIDHFQWTRSLNVVVHRLVSRLGEPQPDHIGASFEMQSRDLYGQERAPLTEIYADAQFN